MVRLGPAELMEALTNATFNTGDDYLDGLLEDAREKFTVRRPGSTCRRSSPRSKVWAGVLDVHDLHVWMVGPGVVACSCDIVVTEQMMREGQQVLRAVVHDIEHRFHITHTTVQVEVEGCEANDM